jgi:hypothetical protein
VVAVAAQRLRQPPVDPRQQQRNQQQRNQQQRNQQQRNQQARPSGGLSVVHACVFVLAAVIGLGAVAFSVKNAEAQKFPGAVQFSMTAIVANAQSYVGTSTSAGNPASNYSKSTQARIRVANYEGVTEQYRVTLTKTVTTNTTKTPIKKSTVINTWNFTLGNSQVWQMTIPYTVVSYKLVAAVYVLPNTKTPYTTVDNGY